MKHRFLWTVPFAAMLISSALADDTVLLSAVTNATVDTSHRTWNITAECHNPTGDLKPYLVRNAARDDKSQHVYNFDCISSKPAHFTNIPSTYKDVRGAWTDPTSDVAGVRVSGSSGCVIVKTDHAIITPGECTLQR